MTSAIAHGDFRVLKPSQKSKVYTWAQELLMMRASAAHIENSLSAIQFCHNSYGFRLPLSRKFEFRNLSKAIASLKGTPKRLFFPVTKEHLRKMMHLRNLTAAQERAVIITSTRSQLCCRVSEVRNFQVCDFLKDQDMAFSSRCRGCAAFQIRKQKIPGEETFTPNVSRNNSSGVHDSMDEGHDNEKRRKTIGKCTKTANPAA